MTVTDRCAPFVIMVVKIFVNHLNNNDLKIVHANKKITEFDGYHRRQSPMSLMVKSDRPNVCFLYHK